MTKIYRAVDSEPIPICTSTGEEMPVYMQCSGSGPIKTFKQKKKSPQNWVSIADHEVEKMIRKNWKNYFLKMDFLEKKAEQETWMQRVSGLLILLMVQAVS